MRSPPGHDGRVKRTVLLLVAAATLALAGCSSGDDDSPAGSSDSGSASGSVAAAPAPPSQFALFPGNTPAAGWQLSEAVKLTNTGQGTTLGSLPGVDWYAEFDGPDGDGDIEPYISLTAYTEPLATRRATLSETADVTDGEIEGRKAFWSSDPQNPDDGAIVTIAFDENYSIEVFATAVDLDELVEIAKTVRPATEAEWEAAGGVVADCQDVADTCPDSAAG